jgi:hypothetical protein
MDWQKLRPSITTFQQDFFLVWNWEMSSPGLEQHGEREDFSSFTKRFQLTVSR